MPKAVKYIDQKIHNFRSPNNGAIELTIFIFFITHTENLRLLQNEIGLTLKKKEEKKNWHNQVHIIS